MALFMIHCINSEIMHRCRQLSCNLMFKKKTNLEYLNLFCIFRLVLDLHTPALQATFFYFPHTSHQSPKGAHPYTLRVLTHTHSITSRACRCMSMIVTLQAFNHRLPRSWVLFRPFIPQTNLYRSLYGDIQRR